MHKENIVFSRISACQFVRMNVMIIVLLKYGHCVYRDSTGGISQQSISTLAGKLLFVPEFSSNLNSESLKNLVNCAKV